MARKLVQLNGAPAISIPINEIGFLAWAMSTQHSLGNQCNQRDGYVVKTKLVQAALHSLTTVRAEARRLRVELGLDRCQSLSRLTMGNWQWCSVTLVLQRFATMPVCGLACESAASIPKAHRCGRNKRCRRWQSRILRYPRHREQPCRQRVFLQPCTPRFWWG